MEALAEHSGKLELSKLKTSQLVADEAEEISQV